MTFKRKIQLFLVSVLMTTSAFSFDLGKALSDAVKDTAKDTINKVTGDAQRKVHNLIKTAIPQVDIGAAPDDGKRVDLSKGVFLFGYQGCPPSRKAFAYMKRNKVRYVLMDVQKDKKASRVARENGFSFSPVLVVNGEKTIGFSESKYAALLKKHKKL